MLYKNISYTTRTFYGVSFKPKEIHDVPGYINDPKIVRVKASPDKAADRSNDSGNVEESKKHRTYNKSKPASIEVNNSKGEDIDNG